MGRSGGEPDDVAVATAASPVEKSGNKRGNRRDAEEENVIKLKRQKIRKVAADIEKKKTQEFRSEKEASPKDSEYRNLLVPCSDSSFSKDPENGNPFEKPYTGAAALAKKKDESRKEPTTSSAHKTIVANRVESTGASKTLAAKNLSFSAAKSDVIEFFKHAGEIVDVRFSLRRNGDFRGNCHIEFATEEAANKAVELDGEYLLGRPVVLGFAREIIFVRGFDTSLGFDRTQSSLEELFSTCGKIYWMHIPTFPYTSVPKGIALIEFFDIRDFPKALAMNGHKLGDSTLTVEDATPVRLNVRPTGGRKRIGGSLRFGPYGGTNYPYGFYYPERGFGGAGIGKPGGIYHFPSGKKTKFIDD